MIFGFRGRKKGGNGGKKAESKGRRAVGPARYCFGRITQLINWENGETGIGN
jgi:hypothetical protein